jgi:PAS domain S-box-containing protein
MNQAISKLDAKLKSGLNAVEYLQQCGHFFPAMLFLYDLEQKEVTCLNDRISEYLGFTIQEFQGRHVGLVDLAFENDNETIKAAIRNFYSLKKGDSTTFTARFAKKEGGCRYLKSVCTRLEEDNVLIVSQDVTDQIKFEEEARATRQLFDETEKLLLFGSWSWSPKHDTLEWTEGLFELLEYENVNLEGFNLQFFLKHVLPEHAEHVQRLLNNSVTSGVPFEAEFVLKTRTGKEKFAFMKGKPMFDQDGNVKKLVGITRDITAKKNFENERDRNIRELNRSNKELEEFAYVASHDLHEPLRKVLTFSERLKNRFGSALGDDGKIYLDRIWASADSMRNLIDNLLEFSKISRGTRSFVNCDLNVVLNEVFSDQELRIEETSTLLNVNALPVVEAVPSEIKQLFNNLLGNALKFRKKDVAPVINIVCKKLTHKEKSEFLLPFNQVFYQLNIQDNGIGFEAVYAEKIFEIFQRLHGKAEYAGSGIGLAICKKIVDNHDGIIFATSEPGKGSTFSVILPEKQH